MDIFEGSVLCSRRSQDVMRDLSHKIKHGNTHVKHQPVNAAVSLGSLASILELLLTALSPASSDLYTTLHVSSEPGLACTKDESALTSPGCEATDRRGGVIKNSQNPLRHKAISCCSPLGPS